MSDIVARLRESVTQARAVDRAALLADAADEIERLRSQPCPYVTGTTTHYCTLTPFTLTDAEREAVAEMAHWCDVDSGYCREADEIAASAFYAARAATLRGLLERTQ